MKLLQFLPLSSIFFHSGRNVFPSLSSDASRREITARSFFGVARLLAEFLNKLAGWCLAKWQCISELRKSVHAKSHEKTWDLA